MRAAFVAATLGLALSTQAHLFLQSPTPIDGSAPKSPLDASGDNFPCHGAALPTSGGQQMAAGSQQLLAFDGGATGANTAVHGGGSCQISITYETDAAKVKDPTNWHVIYSIEGGCPTNSLMNLDGTYTGPGGSYTGSYQCNDTSKTNGVDCLNQFHFEIPKGVKDGHAILAWTWFNNVGNREMYMNCVNTELTGGDGSEMDSFPSMFVANLANVDQCPTTAYQAVAFPNPGKYLTTKLPPSGTSQSTTYALATPTGPGCAGDGGSGSGSASGSTSAAVASADVSSSASPYNAAAAAPSSYATQTSSAATVAAAAASPATDDGTGDVTVTTMATVTGSASIAASPSAAPTSAASPGTDASAGTDSSSGADASQSSSSSSGTSGSCSAGATSCTTDGQVVCIGTAQWGLCNSGCAVPMALADGTTCSAGTITKKRSVQGGRRGRQHVAGRVTF
nr:hypothetical protein CFP56_30084 [Quercus suber]